MQTDSPVATPMPSVATMKLVVVLVTTIQMPIRSHLDPSLVGETFQDTKAVKMSANSSGRTPEPTRTLVDPMLSPQMPVRTNSAPMALVIAVQSSQSVQSNCCAVDLDFLVSAPNPPVSAMERMSEMIATVQSPVSANNYPLGTSPTLQNPHSVQMPANPSRAAPEPSGWPGIMIAFPQVPVRAHTPPMTLVVTI